MEQNLNPKLTKIIATIGPASDSEATLKSMIEAGMNVARFNTKHSDPVWHNERIQRVHKVAKELNVAVAVLLDLQGPEIRIETPNATEFSLLQGESVLITANANALGKVIIVPQAVIDALNSNGEVLLADGTCELRITEKKDQELLATATFECVVKHRKTMNTPGLILNMPSLTERDLNYLAGVDLTLVDYVGLSFVRSVDDLHFLRTELDNRHCPAKIIAKIENQAALDNLESIIQAADAVMVARGDLGVEVPYQQLIFWQKEIIERCREIGRPVITATEMLKSMVENPRPTRAEVSDVAHAIYDGTDAIMLSDETTIGKYPVKVVQTQALIAVSNEPYAVEMDLEWEVATPLAAVCYSGYELLNRSELVIDQVICVSPLGEAASILSSFHAEQIIHVLTNSYETYRQAALMFGILPHYSDAITTSSSANLQLAKDQGIVKGGETVLYIYSSEGVSEPVKNILSVVTLS